MCHARRDPAEAVVRTVRRFSRIFETEAIHSSLTDLRNGIIYNLEYKLQPATDNGGISSDAEAAIHHACQSSWKGSIASAPLQARRSPPPPPLAAACRPQSSSCESHSLASLDCLLQRASPRTCRARRFEGWDALSRLANAPWLRGGVAGPLVDGSDDCQRFVRTKSFSGKTASADSAHHSWPDGGGVVAEAGESVGQKWPWTNDGCVSWLRSTFAWLQESGPDGVFKTSMDLRGHLESLSQHLTVSSLADALSE